MRPNALRVVCLAAVVAPASLGQDDSPPPGDNGSAPWFSATSTRSVPLSLVEERTITVSFVGTPAITSAPAGGGLTLVQLSEDVFSPSNEKVPTPSSVFGQIRGSSTLLVPGEPELPAVVFPVRLGTGETLTVVDASGPTIVFPNVQVAPARQLWPEDSTPRPPRRQSASVYSTPGLYPKDIAVSGERQTLREWTAVPLVVHPFQYDPVKLEVHFRPTVHVKIRIIRQKAAREELGYSSAFATAYVEFGGPPSSSLAATKPPKERVDYIAVVPAELKQALQPLLLSKMQRGLGVKVLEPPVRPTPRETCLALRTLIVNEFARSHPSYLLLVGDTTQIPTWTAPQVVDGTETEIATDLYYATMNGKEDFSADISTGRLPARDARQLKIMVAKILAHERRLGKEPWGRMLMAAEFEHQSASPHTGTREAPGRYFLRTSRNIAAFLRAERYDVTEVVGSRTLPVEPPLRYNDDSEIPGGLSPIDPSSAGVGVMAAWENNLRLVVHRDHGLVDGWEVPSFGGANIRALQPPSTHPVVLSINCSTGNFDGDKECLAEALMRSPNGACAVIAATRPSFSVYNDRLAEGLIGGFWPGFRLTYDPEAYLIETGEARRIGPILDTAKLHVGRVLPAGKGAKITSLLFHLFGDPEMHVVGAPKVVPPSSTEGGPPTPKVRVKPLNTLEFPSTDPTVLPRH